MYIAHIFPVHKVPPWCQNVPATKCPGPFCKRRNCALLLLVNVCVVVDYGNLLHSQQQVSFDLLF